MMRVIAVAILACCSFECWAKDRQLTFDQDIDIYKLTWDDGSISEAEMREIAALSPFVVYSPQYLIGGTAMKSRSGQIVSDKVFMAPELELCVERPDHPCQRNPEMPDALFLQNAARNLQEAQSQLERLRTEKLPRVLEPIRAYLLEHLQLSAERERARYEYLKSGDLEPLRNLLCRECDCTPRDESLLERLRAELEPGKRLQLARIDWSNRVLECERKRHPADYPMEAWERFVKEFGIRETRRLKHID